MSGADSVTSFTQLLGDQMIPVSVTGLIQGVTGKVEKRKRKKKAEMMTMAMMKMGVLMKMQTMEMPMKTMVHMIRSRWIRW